MNGTKAPPLTTLYGLYDRSLGFNRKPPVDLPDVNRAEALDTAVMSEVLRKLCDAGPLADELEGKR